MQMLATAPPTLRAAVHCPCTTCNAHELAVLQGQRDEKVAHWEYSFEAPISCPRCASPYPRWKHFARIALVWFCWLLVEELKARYAWVLPWSLLFPFPYNLLPWVWRIAALTYPWYSARQERIAMLQTKVKVKIPFSMDAVSLIERVLGAATVSEKGSKLRPYGSFISYLTTLEATGEFKTALQVWAPLAIGGFIELQPGIRRRALPGESRIIEDPAEVQDAIEGNEDLKGSGEMPGTTVPRDSYAEDAKFQPHAQCISEHTVEKPEPRILAHQIGPNLRNAECFESTTDNIAAAIDNRFQAPPFKANGRLKARINKTVDALLAEVFTAKKVREWRVGRAKETSFELSCFEDMHSKKWTSDRFARAVDEALADTEARIEQTIQIKTNEVQDSGKKLPRPRNIIQCGDEAQVKMLLPVKCFEDLLFEHFYEASIKKGTKVEAMLRMAKHLAQSEPCTTIEGDGSSWDACCNESIRDLTENRILRHIIEVLGFDAEVPSSWMVETLEDMKQSKIKGKAKTINAVLGKTKIKVNAIRQSGHRGTSAFNYLINLVNWLAVLAENPDELIRKVWNPSKKAWVLPKKYISAYDGCEYSLRYAFEGDDSALTSTEDLKAEGRAGDILESWTSLGFKMKLVYAEKKLTFTGYDFLMAKNGPRPTFMPEIKRNIASSSWTTSPEVRQFPHKLNRVAAAAFLARAENFANCEPLCHYFAALGKSHALKCNGNLEIGEEEAIQLGILPGAILERLDAVIANTHPLTPGERALIKATVGEVPEERWIGLINCHIEDPFDTAHIKHILPKQVWFEACSPKIRPRGADEQLLANCR